MNCLGLNFLCHSGHQVLPPSRILIFATLVLDNLTSTINLKKIRRRVTTTDSRQAGNTIRRAAETVRCTRVELSSELGDLRTWAYYFLHLVIYLFFLEIFYLLSVQMVKTLSSPTPCTSEWGIHEGCYLSIENSSYES